MFASFYIFGKNNETDEKLGMLKSIPHLYRNILLLASWYMLFLRDCEKKSVNKILL